MSSVQKVVDSVSSLLNQKLVQLSLVTGVLFYIVANPALFDFVQGLIERLLGVFKIKVTFDGTKLLIFHSVVFALLFFVISHFLLDGIVDAISKVAGRK